jgi:hypothetical protein
MINLSAWMKDLLIAFATSSSLVEVEVILVMAGWEA